MNEQFLSNRPTFPAQLNMAHPLTRGLIGCWVLNENSPNSMRAWDSSPYGNHGLVTGAKGRWQSRFFNGSSDKIVLGSNTPFDIGAGSYSVGCQFIYSAQANDKPLFNSQVAAGHRRINLRSSAFSRQGPTSGIQEAVLSTAPDITPAANIWTHIFGVYDQAAAKLIVYLQGAWARETASITDEALNASNLNEIGTWSALNFWFDGTIGAVWFYNRALFPLEIRQLYLEPYAMFL